MRLPAEPPTILNAADSAPSRFLAPALLALAFALALTALYALLSHGGLAKGHHNVDWAHHMALTRTIAEGVDPSTRAAQLEEFSYYPRVAHRIAATVASATGLSPLRTLHLVSAFVVALATAIAAARIVALVMAQAASRGAAVLAIGAGGLAFGMATYLGVAFADAFQRNNFYSQAVATPIAMAALAAVQVGVCRGGRIAYALLAATPLAAYALSGTHTALALWLVLGASVCALALATSWIRRLAVGAAVGLAGLGAIVVHPASAAIFAFGQGGIGDLNLMIAGTRLVQLNQNPVLLAMGLAAVGVALLAVAGLAMRAGAAEWPLRVLNVHAGAIAGLALAGVLTASAWWRGAGYYTPAKYVYLLAAEAALLAAHAALLLFAKRRPFVPSVAFGVAAMAVLLVVQLAMVRVPAQTQARLIAWDQALAAARAAGHPAMPALSIELAAVERYYLYIGAAGGARAGAFPLFADEVADDPAWAARMVPPSRVPGVVPAWSGAPQSLVRLDGPFVPYGRWWDPTGDVRHTMGPASYLAFALAPNAPAAPLCATLTPPHLRPGERAHVTLALRAGATATVDFVPGDGPRRVALPLQAGTGSDRFLAFTTDFAPTPAPPGTRGGVGVRALEIAERCE